MRSVKSTFWGKSLAIIMAASTVLFGVTPMMAQEGAGAIVDNSGQIPFDQAYFAFEVEGPVGTLKEVPIWDELEQMLDNPYLFVHDPSVSGNFQGWPSYRSTAPRRRSFIFRNASGEPCAPLTAGCNEVPLAGHVIQPPNYNYQGGEELRILNVDFAGAEFSVPNPDPIVVSVDPDTGQITYEFTYRDIEVEPGEERIEDDEVSIDYNSPMQPDTPVCIVTVEPIPAPEGSILCGGDPGEPGYLGFGVLGDTSAQYSVPAIPGKTGPGDILDSSDRLYDPVRGFIEPRDASGAGGLRKPSLRVPPYGSPVAPGYAVNSEDELEDEPAELKPSNENDYYAGATREEKVAAREAAAALGKSLFWDMQVGSDSVQACGSCHFHAGADNRTKGQLNSNTAAVVMDTTSFEVEDVNGNPMTPNGEVGTNSFPFHKLVDPAISTDPLVNPGNIERTTNDVMSSMGISRFTLFKDIPPIGTFLPPGPKGVASLPPDIGESVPDPFPINQGLRRVEPRHTPTFFASAMNFDNFWDGRARHDFNGGSVFGASDPQSHVFVDPGRANGNDFTATRQIIRFASLASLSTGPALSENEMSFAGRNWAKLGKRLLQGRHTGRPNNANRVVPLANQLVSPDDSVLGIYSNQGGAACNGLPAADRSIGPPYEDGKPGLCISYPGLIKRAFYPQLWHNNNRHLEGCYTDNDTELHPNQCAPGSVAIPVLNADGTAVVDSPADPFDNYVLTIAEDAADPLDTDQFTQMEANFSLFFGLSVHAWGLLLIPDDTPFDRFMDANPDAFISFGEANELALVIDLDTCEHTEGAQPCFEEVGNFKRDEGVVAKLDCPGPEGPGGCTPTEAGGSRTPGSVDPLMGLDFFLGSNLSLKNPNYNTLRCGECHAGGTLTDHTFEISHQMSFNDWAQEFAPGTPGTEIFPEPLGRGRVVTGFALEGELQENAQDAIERNVADFCTIEIDGACRDTDGNPVPGGVVGGFPQGQALFDNGVYNIGVTPIADDVSRGGKDAFGWPLSLSYLGLKNLCGVDYSPGGDNPMNGFAQPASPGIPCPLFDPTIDETGGGVYETTSQDQQINPGFAEEPCPEENDEGECVGMLPPHLAPWASNLTVGDEVQADEVFVGVNTLMAEPMLEGFIDSFGPFNPAAILGENMNNAVGRQMATWPNVNRVNAQGAFKAPPLRNVELTNPYFHDGGNLTLRQQLDFYMRGGNFPITNKAHRDFLIMNLFEEDEALGGVVDPTTCDVTQPLGSLARSTCLVVDPTTPGAVPQFSLAEKEEIIVSVVDYLLELTDERVAYERAPFDHPEIFVPLDGTAPENTTGRQGILATIMNDPVCLDPDTAMPFPMASGPCFRQVLANGAGGNPTKLPNFLDISSGPRLVGAAANCETVNNHYCH